MSNNTTQNTQNTDPNFKEFWHNENVKEYTEVVIDRISELLITKFSEIEPLLDGKTIESVQKTWDSGIIKRGRSSNDIMVVHETDTEANEDDASIIKVILNWLNFTNPLNIDIEIDNDQLKLKAPGKNTLDITKAAGLFKLKDVNLKDNVAQFLNFNNNKTNIDKGKLSEFINLDFTELIPSTFTSFVDDYQQNKTAVPFYRFRTEDFFNEYYYARRQEVPTEYFVEKWFEYFELVRDDLPIGDISDIENILAGGNAIPNNTISDVIGKLQTKVTDELADGDNADRFDIPIYSPKQVEALTNKIAAQEQEIGMLNQQKQQLSKTIDSIESQLSSLGGDRTESLKFSDPSSNQYNNNSDKYDPSLDKNHSDFDQEEFDDVKMDAGDDAKVSKSYAKKRSKLKRRKWMRSDVRYKTNIVKVDNKDGINIYEYNYLWSKNKYRGVMAQEVIDNYPDAVEKDEFGYYLVDYDQLPVNFEILN